MADDQQDATPEIERPAGPPAWPTGWANPPEHLAQPELPTTWVPPVVSQQMRASTHSLSGPPPGTAGGVQWDPQPGSLDPARPAPTGPAYAGRWRRFWAAAVDTALVLSCPVIAQGIAWGVAFLIAWGRRDSKHHAALLHVVLSWIDQYRWWIFGAYWVIVVLAWIAIVPLRLRRDAQTPGMRELGLNAREARTMHLADGGRAALRGVLPWVFFLAPVGVVAGVGAARGDFTDDSDHLVRTIAEMSGVTLAVIALGLATAWLGPHLWGFVDRRHRSFSDVATGVVITAEEHTNWWSVACFATMIGGIGAVAALLPFGSGATTAAAAVYAFGLFPAGIVTGIVALVRSRRSRERVAGRWLTVWSFTAITVLIGISVGFGAPVYFSPDATSHRTESTATIDQRLAVIRSLLPTAAHLPPDLQLLPAPKGVGDYGVPGCQEHVFGPAEVGVEARYAGAVEDANGAPEALDIWIGAFSDSDTSNGRPAAAFDHCTFADTTIGTPVLTERDVGDRALLAADIPYDVGTGNQRHAVTLHAALGSVGHYAFLVLGADQGAVNQMGTDLLPKLP